MVGIFLAVLTLATASLLWNARQADLVNSEEQVVRFASGAQAALNRSLLGIDVLLASMDNLLGLSGAQADSIDPKTSNRLMFGAGQQNLMVRYVALLDAQARVIASSDPSGAGLLVSLPTGFANAVLAQPVSTLMISAPVVSFASGKRVLYLARALKLGASTRVLVVAEVPVPLLTSILVQGANISGLEVTLERSAGQLLASVPDFAQRVDQQFTPALGTLQDTVGARRLPARITGVPALMVTRPTLYPEVLITASVPIEAALKNYHLQRQFIGGVALVFGLMILAAGGFAIQAQEQVLRLNASLEKRVQQRTTELTEEVTERKQAEAELLRFKNVLDNTLDMIFMFEPASLRFVYLNQGAVLSMGYSQEELLGMTAYQIKPLVPEPKFRQLIAPLLSREQSSLRFETVHRRKDGTDFTVNILLQLVTQSDGNDLFVAIVHDITERKRARDEILRLNASLEKQVLQRTELLTKEIAERCSLEIELIRVDEEQRQAIGRELHDGLGQYLTSLSLLSASLQQQLTNRAQPEANAAQRIRELIDEAAAMTRSVVHGLYPVALEYGGLTAALEQLAAQTRSLHKMDCVLDVGPEVPVHDPLVAINLYRIAQEAITNALKHSQAGLMRIGLARVGGKVRLTLSDDGIGIDPSRLGSANGLGMHSMHYRASLLGGDIQVQSNAQQGTTITVTYPDDRRVSRPGESK